jgi:hypothetical protein
VRKADESNSAARRASTRRASTSVGSAAWATARRPNIADGTADGPMSETKVMATSGCTWAGNAMDAASFAMLPSASTWACSQVKPRVTSTVVVAFAAGPSKASTHASEAHPLLMPMRPSL